MMSELRPIAQDLIKRVDDFIQAEIAHNESLYHEQSKDENGTWVVPPIMEEMKAKAKAAGLWNLFLPESENGAGLTNFEYAHLAEIMGAYGIASEVFNCSAPDTGNMEVLERYGNDEHKEKYLKPLLNGDIRSAFAMTEPGVASSDATNIASSAVLDGDEYVINGEKWWTSGAGDPRCEILIFMCVTNPDNQRHQRQSQILVPMNSEGIEIQKMMHVFGYDDAPHGHMHMRFTDVRVPKENMILGPGRGFEVAQGRLGPGRIHHCMRSIGLAEAALKLLCERSVSREAFGRPLAKLGGNVDIIADARRNIEMTRLLCLKAAWLMDNVGTDAAQPFISMIKVAAPNMSLKIIDEAMQMHGGLGLSSDTPLATWYGAQRVLRFADGPDAVHRMVISRRELRAYNK